MIVLTFRCINVLVAMVSSRSINYDPVGQQVHQPEWHGRASTIIVAGTGTVIGVENKELGATINMWTIISQNIQN